MYLYGTPWVGREYSTIFSSRSREYTFLCNVCGTSHKQIKTQTRQYRFCAPIFISLKTYSVFIDINFPPVDLSCIVSVHQPGNIIT